MGLVYKWGASGYPNWFTTGMTTAFGTDWPASAYNNTRMPTFSEFRGHLRGVGEGGEVGLDSSYTPIFKITWSSAC